MTTAQHKLERVFESLDGMGARIYVAYLNGNKSDARLMFRSAPAERRGYLAYTIIGLHTTIGENSHVIDMEEFFQSVTE